MMVDRRHDGLRWRRWGDQSAPTVVLLHAIATDGSIWAGQAEAWGQHHRVVAIDLPGHGESDALPGSPSIHDYAAAVASSLRTGGIDTTVVVGLSIGSMIAQRLAADHPGLVRAVVLANGVAWTDADTCRAWEARIATARSKGMPALREAMLARWFTPDFLAHHSEVAARLGGLIDATPVAGFVQAATAIADLDNRAALKRIGCPALVVAGTADTAAPLSAVAQIASAIPGAHLVELDAPHLANVEAAERFTAEVGTFLDRVDGAPA